jgi:hypothetical protein
MWQLPVRSLIGDLVAVRRPVHLDDSGCPGSEWMMPRSQTKIVPTAIQIHQVRQPFSMRENLGAIFAWSAGDPLGEEYPAEQVDPMPVIPGEDYTSIREIPKSPIDI